MDAILGWLEKFIDRYIGAMALCGCGFLILQIILIVLFDWARLIQGIRQFLFMS